jgi:hypothetical protein
MSHIFRLYKEGRNTINDWDTVSKYGSAIIEQIEDPNGESSKHEITSIPSPFARIDLVKTAFAKVVEMAKKTKTLEGNTIHHKMVSDCFDVGQLFFEFDKHKDKLEIIVWDKENDLNALLKSDNPAHRQLGETYRIYLEQDGKEYNFDRMDRIYLLNFTKYESGTAEMNIIGGTSPATLFFTSANNLDYVTRNIQFGNDRPFDEHYCPLYKRDLEYLKFLWALRININNFSRLFKELDAYLAESFILMDEKTKKTLNAIKKEDINSYSDIPVDGSSSHPVEVLQEVKLKQYIEDCGNIEKDSGFVIDSEYTINGLKPLVLPIDTYTHPTFYTKNNKWDKNTKVPFYVCDEDKKSISPEDRTLPNEGSHYPYLTISDFLTDTIVRMPYEINKESFFDGNIDRANGKSYLLPLTDMFFRFFTTEQLMGNLKDGKKMFELKNNAGGITVVLRIPIIGNNNIEYKRDYKTIEYRRTYFEAVEPGIENNDGGLIEEDFVYAQLPLIKFKNNIDAYYRIVLMSNFDSADKYSISFYLQNNLLKSNFIIRNQLDNRYNKCKTYILEKSNFDYLRINCGNEKSGIIIPKFKLQGGMQQYAFAIDFGTTNMHIEYSVDNDPAKPLDITRDEIQIHLLFKVVDIKRRNILNFDLIPPIIGSDEEFKIPMRTILSESANTDWNGSVHPMAHVNIPFPYEKKLEPYYNKITTNLKWSNDKDNMKRITTYIESLFLILRNKVILNNGDISKTKIVWFYPISMTQHRFDLLKKAWEESYKKYFGTDLNNVIPITESIAPYEFYKSSTGNASNMVSVDIGGGTSDIVIAQSGDVKHITSFRFAANSIFGDGYTTSRDTSTQNGIICQFKDNILEITKKSNMDDLVKIYQRLDNKNISSDIATFLFSLKNNKEVIDANISDDLDFNKILQVDDTQKIVFVFFYVAIIYHLAHLMKAKEIPMPRHLTFSGNGSKVIQILTTNTHLLENFTRLIFEKIYGKKYPTDGLTIIQSPKLPKEATCKGGIISQVKQDYTQISSTKVVLKGSDNCTFISDETYGNIDKQEYIDRTTEEIRKFIQFIFDLNNDFSYKNNFGVDNSCLITAKEECFRDLTSNTENGIKQKLSEVSDDDLIEETFFFYPLKGMLYNLSKKIHELNLHNKQQ